jgi:hypothetical protein
LFGSVHPEGTDYLPPDQAEKIRMYLAHQLDMLRSGAVVQKIHHRLKSSISTNLPPTAEVYDSLRGWQAQVLEADLKTPLPRKFTFADPGKIRELARRGDAWGTSEARQMLELAFEQGRGGLYLKLTPEQYRKLRLFSGGVQRMHPAQ